MTPLQQPKTTKRHQCLCAGNKGQQVCGFDQPNRGGSRCCDVCMFTEDGESVCCPAGSSELCDGNTEAYGCCPDGALV